MFHDYFMNESKQKSMYSCWLKKNVLKCFGKTLHCTEHLNMLHGFVTGLGK